MPVKTKAIKKKSKKLISTNKTLNLNTSDGIFYITLTKNNTIITLTDFKKQVLTWSTCSNCSFKGSERSTEMATITTSEEMGLRARDLKMKRIFVVFRGGGWRKRKKAILLGLVRAKIKLSGFVLHNVIPHNGCRLKKKKNLRSMASIENPIILRQGFTKLWANNIFFHEAKSHRLQFISLFKAKLATTGLMHYRYQRILATRTSKNDVDLDEYANLYKYQKNVRIYKSKRKFKSRKVNWEEANKEKLEQRRKKHIGDERRFLRQTRFKKYSLYNQLFSYFYDTLIKIWGFLFRFCQPLRHLSFVNSYFGRQFFKGMKKLSKQKYFINTVYHIVLLHYYKAVAAFSQHFGRELQKVRKKVHWKLIYTFRNLLYKVPQHTSLRRQFYGITVEIAGRPKGRARTFMFRLSEGTVAPQTFRFRIGFGFGEAFAKVGLFGITTRIAY